VEKADSEFQEISLLDIVNFLQGAWKRLLAASIVGTVLGLAGWILLGQYSAEYILLNNTNTNNNFAASNTNINNAASNTNINNAASNTNINNVVSNTNINIYALDLMSWKTIQKSLPNLAAQILEGGNVPSSQKSLYKSLSSEQWWQKNIVPSYAISKSDTKDLAAISKDLDAASTTILSLTVTSTGDTKEDSIENALTAAKFLRTGGAYLQIRNILNSYEAETISAVADIAKKITSTEIEMGYQTERAKQLEELHKRFPGNAVTGQQVVDPKESGAKYLSISTQIIAVNNDINLSKENIQRLRNRLAQINLMKTFLEEASPLSQKTFDGLVLGDELLKIETQMRAKLAKGDIQSQEILDQLHAQLLQVQARFTKGLEANTSPTATKKGMVKTAASGFAGAFLLMLLVLLGQRVWSSIKAGSDK
jgi:hypothetical protein